MKDQRGISVKILFKNRSFGGGAPKSLLEYIKVARDNGADVLSVGAFNYQPVEYLEKDIRTLNLPYFVLHKPVHNYKVLKRYLKLIAEEKPDIIHTTTLYNIYFQSVIEKLTGIPSIYMIPGGQVSPFAGKVIANLLKDKKLIVYSEENRQELLSYQVRDESIKVIPNRIDFREIPVDPSFYDVYTDRKPEDLIRTLMITRFSETKIHSIRLAIDYTKKMAEDGLAVELTILGSGLYLEQIQKEAAEINQEIGKEIIKLPGYQNNVQEYVKEAHLIYGKGRSVIDGIIQKKLSAVVNENNQVFVCSPDNFIELSDYNLTGRNEVRPTSYQELKDLFKQINQNRLDPQMLDDLYAITKKRYDINAVTPEILELYEQTLSTAPKTYQPNRLKVFGVYVGFYLKLLLQLLKR